MVFEDKELKCSKCYDRKAKIAFRISKCCNRQEKKERESSKMLLSLRKNGLTSLFKEVRVFKEWRA